MVLAALVFLLRGDGTQAGRRVRKIPPILAVELARTLSLGFIDERRSSSTAK